MNRQILFCAGEDSGDILGEAAVSTAVSLGFKAVGSGGERMQSKGLKPLIPYNDLPLSGYSDVLPHYFRLRKNLKKLIFALQDPNCKALVAIDYPGFNLRLKAAAEKMGKPVFYIAPPQIWAWKESRGNLFQKTPCAVLYPFEENIYKKYEAFVSKLNHPFEKPSANLKREKQTNQILFLPGSRLKTALRNLPLYLKIADEIMKQDSSKEIIFGISRKDLLFSIEDKVRKKYSVTILPKDARKRALFFSKYCSVLAPPGTAHAETSLCGTPSVACHRIDLLTYFFGKKFLKIPSLIIPNLIAEKKIIPEYYIPVGKSLSPIIQQTASELMNPSDQPFQRFALEHRNAFTGISVEKWIREQITNKLL